MNGIDWIIVGLVVLFALYGSVQGFVAGLLSLAGFAIGAFSARGWGRCCCRRGPSRRTRRCSACSVRCLRRRSWRGLLEGSAAAAARGTSSRRVGVVDGTLGALLTACVAFLLAWVLGAVALQSPAAPRSARDLQRSVILRELNDVLPPSGPILNALARFDPLPRIAGPRRTSRRRARRSRATRRCGRLPRRREGPRHRVRPRPGRIRLGRGDGLVVTNAHVVAGEDDTTVQLDGEGDGYAAQAVHFDSRNDVAVLRVPGLGGPPLRARRPIPRGHPGGDPRLPPERPLRRARRAASGQTATALSEDAYGRGPIRRR